MTAQPADCPHWSGYYFSRPQPYERGVTTNEYCQILGGPSICREFYFTWFPMIRPILLGDRPSQTTHLTLSLIRLTDVG